MYWDTQEMLEIPDITQVHSLSSQNWRGKVVYGSVYLTGLTHKAGKSLIGKIVAT